MNPDFGRILAAQYMVGYQVPGFSGNEEWGWWGLDDPTLPPEHRHLPGHILPNGERDIASVVMPVIGPYASGDQDACEYHILLAKAAGIEAFIITGLGARFWQTVPTLQPLQALVKTAEKLDFKLALCLEDASFFPPACGEVTERKQALKLAAEFLGEAEKHLFSSPACLRLPATAVVTTSNQGFSGEKWDSPFFLPEEWEEIRKLLPFDICVIQNYHPGISKWDFRDWDSVYPSPAMYHITEETESHAGGEFWANSEHALGKNRYRFISGLVTSGIDNRGSGNKAPQVFSRQQGAKYISTWEDNLHHDARFIQIGTWNHFREGSCIEPVKEIVLHKNPAVPGWGYRELITTREYAARFTSRKLWPLPALFLPERLYRLRKSGAPEQRGHRIRLYLLEGDIEGANLGLEQAGV